MAKSNLEDPTSVIAVHVAYPDARLVPKVESRICNHGEIVANLYLRAPDKNKIYRIRSASYVIVTHDPRNLKRTLTQLQKADSYHLSF